MSKRLLITLAAAATLAAGFWFAHWLLRPIALVCYRQIAT